MHLDEENSPYAGAAILGLNRFKALRGVGHRLFPGHFFPWVVDTVANHGYCNAVFMGGITKGKSALNTGMAFIGLAVFVGCHAHYLIALHLGFKRAANATVGAGGSDRMFRFTGFDNTLFSESRRWAGVDTGTTGDTFGIHKVFRLTGADFGFKAAAIDGQGKGALHFFTGAHTA